MLQNITLSSILYLIILCYSLLYETQSYITSLQEELW